MNKKIFVFFVSLLLATTNITHAMKSLTSCFPFLFCCCSKQKATDKQQEKLIKKDLILKKLKITINTIETIDPHVKKSKLSFLVDNVEIGHSIYENKVYTNKQIGKDYIYLHQIFLNDDYRNCGLGKEMFKITMDNIHEKFPEIEIIEWEITPIGDFESLDAIKKAQNILFIFYKKCNAIVDEEKNVGYINLKNTGYFDKK